MTCITPNLFTAFRPTNSWEQINDYHSIYVYVGFSLDGVTAYKNISNVIPNFMELLVYNNPECYRKDYVFEKDEYIRINVRIITLGFGEVKTPIDLHPLI